MLIRELNASDLNNLLRLYKYLHVGDTPISTSTAEATWQEIQSSSRYKYFGGWADDKLVSTCTITIVPNLTRGGRPYGLIENVVTDASFRKRGFAKAVLNATLAYAWSVNCYKVMLLTGRKSEEVFRFYESVGFDRHEKQAFIAKP